MWKRGRRFNSVDAASRKSLNSAHHAELFFVPAARSLSLGGFVLSSSNCRSRSNMPVAELRVHVLCSFQLSLQGSFSLLTSDSRAALLVLSLSNCRSRSKCSSFSVAPRKIFCCASPLLTPSWRLAHCFQPLRISLKLNHPHSRAQNFFSPLHQAHHLSSLPDFFN